MTAPQPPSGLAGRTPLTLSVKAGAILSRFYQKANGPIYFDPGKGGRLNAPNGAYGVLYAAKRREGAFAETFLRKPGITLIARDFMDARAHVSVRVAKALKLVKFYGNGLARIGATAQVTHGGLPYEVPQQWSLALHKHKGKFDGIAYYARHNDDELCFALFERSRSKLVQGSLETDLDQDWFYELARHHGVSIAPD